MTNKWIEHVKKYAKDNNLSYGCAFTCPNLKKDYIPVVKLSKKEKEEKKTIKTPSNSPDQENKKSVKI